MATKTVRFLSGCALAAGLFITAPACATAYPYPASRDYRQVERVAYDNGFRDGVHDGSKDAHSGHAFSMERHGDWRDADDGYHRDYGDKDLYRRSFRDGFRDGYSQGFQRRAY